MDPEFLKAYASYIEMIEPRVKRNDYVSSCMKQILHPVYWEAVKKLDTENETILGYVILGLVIGIVLIVAIILLICFIRKKDKEEFQEELDTD